MYLFKGEVYERNDSRELVSGLSALGATLGYRSDESLEVDVDYLTTTFDSRFLESVSIAAFLGQIGHVPGMAATVKANLGPVPLIAEWNGALEDATFTDDLGRPIAMRPSAWQVSARLSVRMEPMGQRGARRDWHVRCRQLLRERGSGRGDPRDLRRRRAGWDPSRKSEFMVSAGEWVWDGVRIAVEYSHLVDYPKDRGGTGGSANGVFSMVTFEW